MNRGVRPRTDRRGLRAPRGWHLAGVIAGKAIFVAWAVVSRCSSTPGGPCLRHMSIFTDDDELDHGDDLSARPLRRGSGVRLSRRDPRGATGLGSPEVETTVDFRPRNPVLTWRSAASTSRSSITCSRACRTRTIRRSQRSCAATRQARCPLRVATVAAGGAALALPASPRMGRLGLPAEIEMG